MSRSGSGTHVGRQLLEGLEALTCTERVQLLQAHHHDGLRRRSLLAPAAGLLDRLVLARRHHVLPGTHLLVAELDRIRLGSPLDHEITIFSAHLFAPNGGL